MSREAVLELLRQRIGLDAASLGNRVIDDACADARRTLGVSDDENLFRRMLLNPDAFALALEHFLVPESWFYRAGEQFNDVLRFAREQRERRPLRILSLPCASGEELYSAVIRLLEAGLAPKDIDALGIDISEPCIERARSGRYRPNALRGGEVDGTWLLPAENGFEVAELVRNCTHFRIGNALDDVQLRGEDHFDVIFCRNLLIYLHPEARLLLLRKLRNLLGDGGLLLCGQAEIASSLVDDFQPWPNASPLSFVVRRQASEKAEAATQAPKHQATGVGAGRSATAGSERRHGNAPAGAPAPLPPPPAPSVPSDLEQARVFADAGNLQQAHALCSRWLGKHPVDSEGFYLLGLIESARGEHEAADQAFARVLYLDRNHLDALEQRVAMAERRGRGEQARDLRARVARMRQQQAGPT